MAIVGELEECFLRLPDFLLLFSAFIIREKLPYKYLTVLIELFINTQKAAF